MVGVTGWTLRFGEGDQWGDAFVLARDAERAVKIVRGSRKIVAVEPARAWRGTFPHGGEANKTHWHHYWTHGRDAEAAWNRLASGLLGAERCRRARMRIAECDPYWLFMSLPERELANLARPLWTSRFLDKHFGRTFRTGEISTGMREKLCMALRLAMLPCGWPPPDYDEGTLDPAVLAVHDSNAYVDGKPSLAPARRCVEAGLVLPLPTETQRDALKDLARAYCLEDAQIEAMTDTDLLSIWREGYEAEIDWPQ